MATFSHYYIGGPGPPSPKASEGQTVLSLATLTKTNPPPFSEGLVLVGPAGFEPATNRLCVPTTTFVASLEFVVWTVSLPRWGICRTVSTPFRYRRTWLGIASPLGRGFPEFDRLSPRNY